MKLKRNIRDRLNKSVENVGNESAHSDEGEKYGQRIKRGNQRLNAHIASEIFVSSNNSRSPDAGTVMSDLGALNLEATNVKQKISDSPS